MTFENTNANPNTTNRTITVVVSDGTNSSATATTTITVTSNDAPTLDLDGNVAGNNYSTSFTEDGSAVAVVDTDVTITDGDDTNIESATITLTNAQTDDVLAAGSLPAGISSNLVGNVLTLSGSATLAQYQTALQAVTFENTSENPNTTNRTITIVVNDGVENSATATTTVTVNAADNDAPTLDLDDDGTGNDYSTSFAEGDSPVAVVDTDVAITDVDDTNIESATITLTNAQTDDVLAAGSLPAGISSNLVGNVLTLSGSATLAQYQTALQAVTFENTNANPNTTNRTITVVVSDGTNSSATATTTITVTSNDAPTLDLDGNVAGNNYSTSFTEDGTAVAVVDTDVTITDGDDTNIESATITLTNAQTDDVLAAGSLPAGISSNLVGNVLTLSGSATLAQYQTALQAVTFENTSENPNTTNRTITIVVNDGVENSATATTTVTVNAADNDAPTLDLDDDGTGNDYSTSFVEGDSPVAVVDTDVAITDVDDTNIESATITLTNAQTDDVLAAGSLPAGISSNLVGNVLTLSGSATLAQYQTALQAVTFENTNANPNTTNRTITVVVSDGTNSSATATTTITVTSNDAPTLDLDGNVAGNNYSTSFTEDGTAVAVVDTDVTITDGDDTNIESATITLTNAQTDDVLAAGSLPAGISSNLVGNVLTLSGSATLAQYQTALQAVTFENTSENPNTTNRTITIVVNDGVENSATATTTVTVTAQNDAPTMTDTVVTMPAINEDAPAPSSSTDGVLVSTLISSSNASDVDGDTLGIAVRGVSVSGSLYYSTDGGTTWSATPLVSADVSPAASFLLSSTARVYFRPNSDFNGAITDAITFRAWDGTSGSEGDTGVDTTGANNGGTTAFSQGHSETVGITVNAVNDAPTTTNLDGDSFTYDEGDGPQVLDQSTAATLADIDSTDFNGGNLTVTITSGEDAAEDLLSFNNSVNFGTNANDDVSIGSTVIGTLGNAIGEGSDLVVNFNSNATPALVQTLLQAITYTNSDNDDPTAGARNIRVTVNDGDGGTSADADVTVTVAKVNDAPTIANLNGDSFTYNEGDGAQLLDQSTDATLSDVDSTNVSGGNLTVTITANEDAAEDLLQFNNTVTLSGTTANSTVTVGGINVGTLANDIGVGNDLVVNFGANATPALAQSLIRAITYTNTDTDDPTAGARNVRVTVNDGDGGTSANADVTVTVNKVNDAPEVSGLGSTLTFTEDDGATVIDSDIIITDADNANIGSATIQITSNYQNGEDVLSIDNGDLLAGVADSFNASNGTLTLSGSATKAQYELMLEKVKYNNTSQHPSISDRTVTWTVNDGALNSVNSGRASTIEITRLNDAPVLDNTQSPALVAVDEDSRPVNGSTAGSTLVSALTGGISDVDTGDATGIAITAVDSDGTLYYSADGTGSAWTELTGTVSDTSALLLSSTARIYFKPNSDHDQDVSAAITFRAWDQTGSDSNGDTGIDTSTNGLTTPFSVDTDTVSIVINPVSDAPHFSGNGSLAAINEDASASGATVTSLFSSLFQDVDTGDSMLGVAITNDASDSSDGTWQYSTDGSNWHNIGLVANNAGLLLSNTAMLRFNPALNFNGAPGALTVHAVDNSAVDPVEFTSGTTRELFDTTGDNAESHVSIAGVLLETSINAENDAPTLTAGYNARMPNVAEDAGVPSGSDGVLLSTVVNAAGNDVDTNSGIQGVAISAVSSDGRLYYSTNNGASWSYIGDDQDLTANQYLLLDGSARVYFKPDANFNGAVSDAFTFRAWDASDSRSQGLHSITSLPTGGTEAYSSSTLDVAIDVVAGNDAPTATDNTFAIGEDGSHTFAAANFGYSDTESSPLDSITITSLPGQGSLTLNGVAVTANQVIDASSIGNLVFSPATNANGNNYASFQFTVSDGSLDSVTPNTITFNVNAVNDLPTGTDDTITILEDGSHTFTAADFGYSDVEGSSLDRVQITSLPTPGTLQLSGANVALNDEIAFADIGNLVFSPATNANGAGYASIGFKVHDGTAFSAAANTLTIDVTADNDAPTASDQSVTLTEDGSHTFASSEFGFSDIDTGDTLSSIRITSLPGAGVLTLNNAAVSMGQVIAESDIENLVFTPAANDNGNGYATFQFRVNDGTVDSTALYTMTINVNAVNDAPSLTGPASLPVTEDATSPAGATVTSLFGSLFQDSADSNTMIGIAIAGDASTASEGVWQYTTDGTNWHAIGTVSSSGALLLDNGANTRLRFVPAVNYDGASGALTVHAVENSGTAPTFTSGSTRHTFDTDADDATSRVSASGVDLTASVNSVNDQPSFSGGATLASVDEDTTSPSGSSLSDLFGGLFQDNDGADSFDGIAIVADAATTAQGNWEYTTDGSTWHDLGTVSTSAAVLLENTANTKLRFVPTANYNGTPGGPDRSCCGQHLFQHLYQRQLKGHFRHHNRCF